MLAFIRKIFYRARGSDAPDTQMYKQYDRHLEDLRRAKLEVREMRRVLARPTGNFVEDMSTGRGGDGSN